MLKFWHAVMQCGGVGVREHGSVLPLLLSSQVMSHAVAVKAKAGVGWVVWLVCSCSKADSGLAVTALSPVPAAVAQSAKARRREHCYVHVCDLLKVLKESPSKKAPASLDSFKKSLVDGENAALASALISGVSSSDDPFLQESIYATLIELSCVQDLLAMAEGRVDTGENLEQYLFQSSGLATAMYEGAAKIGIGVNMGNMLRYVCVGRSG